MEESESAKFWLHVLTDLQNRVVKDILIVSVNGLKGFTEAINAVFPNTQQPQVYSLTKTKAAFPNDDSLLKLLFMEFKMPKRMDNAHTQLEFDNLSAVYPF